MPVPDEETSRSMDESFTTILKEMRYETTPGQKRRKKKVQVQPGRSVVGADFANEEKDEEHEEETEEDSKGDSELENADNDDSEKRRDRGRFGGNFRRFRGNH